MNKSDLLKIIYEYEPEPYGCSMIHAGHIVEKLPDNIELPTFTVKGGECVLNWYNNDAELDLRFIDKDTVFLTFSYEYEIMSDIYYFGRNIPEEVLSLLNLFKK